MFSDNIKRIEVLTGMVSWHICTQYKVKGNEVKDEQKAV